MTLPGSGQGGQKLPSVFRAKEAFESTRGFAKLMLMIDDLSLIRERWPKIAQCFQSRKAKGTGHREMKSNQGRVRGRA
jgi:hypothetical protein